jgi:hypothetical protein
MNDWEEKFQQLKKHKLFPFSDLKDETQYMLLELYWAYLFKSVVGSNESRLWRAWREPDGDREGNPIFSAINLTTARGVSVTQHPGPDDPDVKLWGYFPFQPYLAHSSATPSDIEPDILEFAFLGDVSERSEACSRKFWKWFCVDRVLEVEMEHEIKRYEVSVGMPDPESRP